MLQVFNILLIILQQNSYFQIILNFWIFFMISLMACQVSVFPQVVLRISNRIISDISILFCFVKANEASSLSRNDLILKKLRIGCTDKFECNSKTLKIIICKCIWTCEIKFETHSQQYKKGVLPCKVKASVLVGFFGVFFCLFFYFFQNHLCCITLVLDLYLSKEEAKVTKSLLQRDHQFFSTQVCCVCKSDG